MAGRVVVAAKHALPLAVLLIFCLLGMNVLLISCGQSAQICDVQPVLMWLKDTAWKICSDMFFCGSSSSLWMCQFVGVCMRERWLLHTNRWHYTELGATQQQKLSNSKGKV